MKLYAAPTFLEISSYSVHILQISPLDKVGTTLMSFTGASYPNFDFWRESG